jgi:hypothetical protein
LRGWSWQVDGYVVVSDPFIPPAQRPTASFLDEGPLIVLAGEAPDSINTGEERDRGKHDLLSVVLAQQARTAEAVDTLQVTAHLRFIVTLLVFGRGLRRPPAPYPRDHLPSLR